MGSALSTVFVIAEVSVEGGTRLWRLLHVLSSYFSIAIQILHTAQRTERNAPNFPLSTAASPTLTGDHKRLAWNRRRLYSNQHD